MRLTIPSLDQHEIDEVTRVLATGYLTQGPKVAEFERLVAGVIGARHAFAMSSCTTALHLSLVALGVGPGDEVLVSDFTFPATANVVIQQGARPVLVDVSTQTYNLEVQDLAARITPKTRAIIPVHAFGLSAEMDPLMALAQQAGLPVIEDAACALGARYGGRACGTFGTLGCFSFHPRKSITTGEGGLIATDDDALARRIALLRSHGGERGELYYEFTEAGFNYRMSDLQAAVGVAQMGKLAQILVRKRELAGQLTAMLANLAGITPPMEPVHCRHTYQSYVVLLDTALDRDAVIRALRRRQVECTLGTYALHAQPLFRRDYGYTPGDLPGSYRAFRQSLTLPLYADMTSADLELVVSALADSIREVA